MRNSVVFVALSALGAVNAVKNFTIDPSAVPLTQRSNWCSAQGNTCSTLCDGNPKANSCDPNLLTFNCLCQNGTAPGLEYYTQTLPTFICQEAYSECNAANVGNAQGQKNCTTSIQDQCGSLNPDNYTAVAASSSAPATSATATDKGASASATNTPAPSSTKSANGAMPTAVGHLGNGAAAVALGLFAYLL
ncbi:uncharacterized protein SPSK_09608 [Sporothrix schenckii 1099-18]|uniref:DUF7707 domain-containing protein n=1 Tax=Sporothrix schenckii 1099-18 TaxID=1397361 RepID=A0A0F2M6A4_SPOSC|nr:uncharacterized protein SPSK_09608 [Sporothrix schenckii 1099-18]KJR85223.1 hypothetical protein SPSK_09608 [Sporothrix schenckii 1099-18]